MDLAGEEQLAGCRLAHQRLDLLHRQAEEHRRRQLLVGDGAGGDHAAGQRHQRLGGLVESVVGGAHRGHHLRRRRQRAPRLAVAVEGGDQAVAERCLQAAVTGGDGVLGAPQVAGQAAQRLLRIGRCLLPGVAAQLDGEHDHVPELRRCRRGRGGPGRLGQGTRQVAQVALHVALLAQVGEQVVESRGELAHLVAALDLHALVVVALAGGLGARRQAPHRAQRAPRQGVREERGGDQGQRSGGEQHPLDAPEGLQRLFQGGESHGGSHRLTVGALERGQPRHPRLARELDLELAAIGAGLQRRLAAATAHRGLEIPLVVAAQGGRDHARAVRGGTRHEGHFGAARGSEVAGHQLVDLEAGHEAALDAGAAHDRHRGHVVELLAVHPQTDLGLLALHGPRHQGPARHLVSTPGPAGDAGIDPAIATEHHREGEAQVVLAVLELVVDRVAVGVGQALGHVGGEIGLAEGRRQAFELCLVLLSQVALRRRGAVQGLVHGTARDGARQRDGERHGGADRRRDQQGRDEEDAGTEREAEASLIRHSGPGAPCCRPGRACWCAAAPAREPPSGAPPAAPRPA